MLVWCCSVACFCDDCCVSFGLSVLQPFACFFFLPCVIQSIWVRLGLELECWHVYICWRANSLPWLWIMYSFVMFCLRTSLSLGLSCMCPPFVSDASHWHKMFLLFSTYFLYFLMCWVLCCDFFDLRICFYTLPAHLSVNSLFINAFA